ncbi:hypothetical protein JYU34_006821 [Plutella xylostella]|uniref:Uncharacterized protein n=1 Tax=Plutella xylostella TaxID=51655 RepID=A0ABQ7QSX9_PLUXY|nr:hypothetical protein JYU34_006821 [Plutella xylostella]
MYPRRERHLRLNEILEELECTEDKPLPDFISILPPKNFNADVTDEDSGEENQVFMKNLPGSQLRVQAIVHYNEPDISESDDEEDSLSLADLYSKTTSDWRRTGCFEYAQHISPATN